MWEDDAYDIIMEPPRSGGDPVEGLTPSDLVSAHIEITQPQANQNWRYKSEPYLDHSIFYFILNK